MKSILLALLMLTGTVRCFAQDATVTVKTEAQKMADAMRKGDYDKLAAYTPGQVVAKMGGKETMVAFIKRDMDGMKAQGITFQDVRIGEPGPMQAVGNEMVSLIPQTVVLKVPGGHLESDAYLIAISGDGGKSWVFADSTSFTKDNEASIKTVFPELIGKLHIPEKKEPVFTAD